MRHSFLASTVIAAAATLAMLCWHTYWQLSLGTPGHCVRLGDSVTFCELERREECGQRGYWCLQSEDGSIRAVTHFRREELVAYYKNKRAQRWILLVVVAVAVFLQAYGRLWDALWHSGKRAALSLHPLKLHAR